MEIYEIEKEKMDSLKALADVNERVSKAVELVEKLKLEESVYIKEREEIAVKKINDVQVSLAVFKAEYRKDLNTVKIFAAIVGTVITIFANFGMKLWKPV